MFVSNFIFFVVMPIPYISSWISTVRQHFVKAFDFSRPFCSRVTNFALGVIKAIPIVGHIVMEMEWLVSSCVAGIITRSSFTSDVVQIVKTEKALGRDHISRVAEILQRERGTITPENQDKVHGKFPVCPFGRLKSEETLKLKPGEREGTLDTVFSPIRTRVTRAYLQAPRPEIRTISIVGSKLKTPQDFSQFVSLANETQRLHPEALVCLYLTGLNRESQMCDTTTAEKKQYLHNSGLDSRIQCKDSKEDDAGSPENPELWIGYYSREQQHNIDGQYIQQCLGKSADPIPWIHVTEDTKDFYYPPNFTSYSHTRQSTDPTSPPRLPESEGDKDSLYGQLSRSYHHEYMLGLGLKPEDAGLLMDPDRIYAPLSQGHYCHSYLADIENEDLRTLVLSPFLDPGNLSSEDLRPVAFNIARLPLELDSLFFRLVAGQQEGRNIVTLAHGTPRPEDLDPDSMNILTRRLQMSGYSYLNIFSYKSRKMIVKERQFFGDRSEGKSFTLILFEDPISAADFRCLQLAAEGMVAKDLPSVADICASGCSCIQFSEMQSPQAIEYRQWEARVEDEAGEEAREPVIYSQDQLSSMLTTQQNFVFSLDAVVKQAIWRFRSKGLLTMERKALGEEFLTAIFSYLGSQERNENMGKRTTEEHEVVISFEELDRMVQVLPAEVPADSGNDPTRPVPNPDSNPDSSQNEGS
ncbi:Uncharacterized protein BN1224_PB2_A_04760 [Chlamydia pneumoniae]|nr:Uncharacterized protein BN1224_PB2_A_04760 [Chlamydia pneumoniae]